MNSSKDKIIHVRVTNELYSLIDEITKEKNISMSEYGRIAFKKQIQSDKDLENYEYYLTLDDVRPAMEAFAITLKNVVGQVNEINDMQREAYKFQLFAEFYERLEEIEKLLGIKRPYDEENPSNTR